MFNSVIHAPLHNPLNIADIGCGTGVQTHLFATKYPSARVYGVDISPVPNVRPKQPNIEYVQGDIRSLATPAENRDARFPSATFDYIFNRLLVCGISDWPGYICLIAGLLKPGGWAEMQDINYEWFQHGKQIDREWRWLRELRRGAERKGLDIHCGNRIAGWMREAGLVDVSVREYRIPVGTWEVARRPETRRIGEHMKSDLVGLYWHMIERLCCDDKSEGEIEEMRLEMRENLKAEEGKDWVIYVTVGRKA